MKTALIISGGLFSKPFFLPAYDYVIACDKGVSYAKELNIVPNVILGDFDSYDGNVEAEFHGIPVERFPIEKDDTDTMLAIKHALEKGYMHIVIICALGLRIDHMISNLQSLHYIAANGGIGEIYSETEHLRTFSDKEKTITLTKRDGFSLSLFSLTDKCEGLSISGAKYNAEKITLTNTFPLGHGNSFKGSSVTVSLESGNLIISESKLEQ